MHNLKKKEKHFLSSSCGLRIFTELLVEWKRLEITDLDDTSYYYSLDNSSAHLMTFTYKEHNKKRNMQTYIHAASEIPIQYLSVITRKDSSCLVLAAPVIGLLRNISSQAVDVAKNIIFIIESY